MPGDPFCRAGETATVGFFRTQVGPLGPMLMFTPAVPFTQTGLIEIPAAVSVKLLPSPTSAPHSGRRGARAV